MEEFYKGVKSEFAIRERESEERVKQFAQIAFEIYKMDYKCLTWFIMAINHMCWDRYHAGDEKHSQLYSDLYYEYDEKAINYLEEHGTQEELSYFFRTLD